MLTIKGVDIKNHKFRGYKEGQTEQLSCSACGTKLLDLVVVQENIDVCISYRAKCHKCGDFSYPVQLVGEVLVNPASPDDVMLINVEVEDGFLTAILKAKETNG